MNNCIELDGGIIRKGTDAGKPIYFLSAVEQGAKCVLWESHSYALAVIEAQLVSAAWDLPIHDRIRAGK